IVALPAPGLIRPGRGARPEATGMLPAIAALARAPQAPVAALEEVPGGAQPQVIRGLAGDWPLVRAARSGDADAVSYLKSFANPALPATATVAPPGAGGRISCDADLGGFGFRREPVPPDVAL